MIRARLPLGVLALSCGLLSSCASLGGNISGSFNCKAPGGSCAPTAQIDAAASAAMLEQSRPGERRDLTSSMRTARTDERTLKIVFPGYVDASGNLHEARSVHVITRPSDWAATLAGEGTNIARQMARKISGAAKNAHKDDANDALARDDNPKDAPPDITGTADPFLKSSYNLPSRGSYPLTVREAIAGASMPAIEGFDRFPPPESRTPHPHLKTPPRNRPPSIEAIEAAKAAGIKKRAEKGKGQ
jgi:conjugal transfer pilus assembly protein TraV